MAEIVAWKQPFHFSRRFLAKFWLNFFPNLTVIGITGSYGKTNTTVALNSVLSQRFKTRMTDLNLDTRYNLPITLLKIRPGDQKLILELGVDHRGEMNSYLKMVKPTIGVLTGISPVHSEPELLGSLEGIIKEKGRLLEVLPESGYAVLNYDDPIVRKMAGKTKAKIVWYSLKDERADYWAKNIKVGIDGTQFTCVSHDLNHDIRTKEIVLKTGLIGRHFIHACLLAVAIGRIQGLNWQEITKGLEIIRPLPGRVNLEKGPKESVIINDSLRANPASTLAGLQVLSDLPAKGKRIAVLGEMGELGRYAQSSHQELGKQLPKFKIDYLISIGPLQKFTANQAKRAGMKNDHIFVAENVQQAAQILTKLLNKGDLIYLKGSRLRHLERISLILENKKVGCKRISCQFYHHCLTCQYLEKGLPE